MKNVIEIDNLSCSKGNVTILNSICLKIQQGEFVSIVGTDGAGKSSLIKNLLGFETCSSGLIHIFDKDLYENKNDILKRIGYVAENCDSSFVTDRVIDELSLPLRNLHFSEEEIQSKIQEISSYLHIDHMLDCIPRSLSIGQKQLISLATALIINPDILIVDDSLDMIDLLTKDKILSLFRKLHREKKVTILYVTHDLEDTLYADRIILLSNGNICLDEKTKTAFTKEKIFQSSGLSLPFMVDLSKKLQYYNLIDKIEYNMDRLVNKLWK